MIQFLKRCKIQITVLICFVCLFLGLSAVKLSVYAKEKAPYYIKVNKQQNCVTIYKQDEEGKYTVPVKVMTCSSGTATPLGTYKTLDKYRWKLLMGDVWGQYSTRIFEGVLFHSVWYYDMDASTLSAKQYNKLGTTASHGCIRLTVADAKWIYDNCVRGTTVEIYEDKDPGPLGKPDTLLLPDGTGWDPTDPSEDNPFLNDQPVIKGASNKSIAWGTKINLLRGVKASSTTGTDITGDLEVSGKIDIYKAGKYKITYSITDASGKTTKKNITLTVKKCKEEPKFVGITDRSINTDTVINREFALKGVTAYLATKKLSSKDIKVEITQNEDHSYALNYSITGENGLTANAVAKAYIDTTAPVIKGITHKELTLKQLKTGKIGIKKIALQDITVDDDYSKITVDKVKVSIQALSNYGYIVTYTVKDDAGNATTETVQFTYFKDTKIIGVTNHHDIPYGTEINEEFVKQGITAENSLGDCTDQITVGIGLEEVNQYEVTYFIPDEEGNTISVVSYFTAQQKPEVQDNTETDTTEETESAKETELDVPDSSESDTVITE